MQRLTITLTDTRHRALKEAALRRGKTIGALIEESLDHYGIKPREDAADLVAAARRSAALPDDDAMQLAINETRAHREGR